MPELTGQETFWQGEFGDQYVERNIGQPLVAANLALFAKALTRVGPVDSLLEPGTHAGNNYGSGYHRDRQFPVDDMTWFVLEKRR